MCYVTYTSIRVPHFDSVSGPWLSETLLVSHGCGVKQGTKQICESGLYQADDGLFFTYNAYSFFHAVLGRLRSEKSPYYLPHASSKAPSEFTIPT